MTETAKLKLHELLKKERVSQALTLEMVSERLKLTKAQLEYFESPDLDLEQLSTFQRGYLRNYAEILSMDIGEFESAFPKGITVSSHLSKVEQDSAEQKPMISNGLMRWGLWVIVAVIVIVLIAINQ